MSSESPKPVSVADNHTDAKESESETDNKKDGTTNRSLQQSCQVVIIPEKEKDTESVPGTESTKKTGYTAKQKGRITKWLREAPIETKSVVINFWMAVFTLVMVIFTVILTAVSLWQAYIAQNALKASQDSVVVARQALDEARKSGEEASRLNAQMLEANQRLAGAAQLQADSVKESVIVGKSSARAAEKSAQLALFGAQPRVEVQTFQIVTFEANQKLHIDISLINTGRSTALKFNLAGAIARGYPPIPNPLPMGEVDVLSSTDLGAGLTQKMPLYTSEPITTDEFNEIKNGKQRLFVIGKGIYYDEFSHCRQFGFCMYYDKGLNTLANCPANIKYEQRSKNALRCPN